MRVGLQQKRACLFVDTLFELRGDVRMLPGSSQSSQRRFCLEEEQQDFIDLCVSLIMRERRRSGREEGGI